jgi:hypothetical protein
VIDSGVSDGERDNPLNLPPGIYTAMLTIRREPTPNSCSQLSTGCSVFSESHARSVLSGETEVILANTAVSREYGCGALWRRFLSTVSSITAVV